MNIINSTISDLLEAHRKLDSVEFTGDSGKARYSIARNLRALNEAAEDLMKKRDCIIHEVSGGTNIIKKDTPEMEAYSKRSTILLCQTREIKLFSIPYPVIENQTPPTVITALWDVLVGMPDIGDPDL